MKNLEAGIFDLDGVITHTAELHQEAWRQLFDAYRKWLDQKGKPTFEPYQAADYPKYIDGRSRLDGLKAFLKSRDIELPTGSQDDEFEDETLYGLGNFKNEAYRKLIDEKGVGVYEEAVERIRAWRKEGLKTAVISASKNCAFILKQAGLEDLFDTRIDGNVAEERGLPGKPDPAIMLEAARELGVDPSDAFVVEDALPGVAAASKGDFGMVVGVVRNAKESELQEKGADITVSRLDELEQPANGKVFPEELPNALAAKRDILDLLQDRNPLLFLDFDGTLAPIVENHEEAAIDPEIRKTLEKMAAEFMLIAIVSGRDLQDVKDRVHVDRLYYLGSHGYDMSGPADFSEQHPKALDLLPRLEEVEAEAREQLKDFDGVSVERKRFAIALHYRKAKEEGEKAVRETVGKITENDSRLKKSRGKKVLEIRPNIDWDKGKAISWLMNETGVNESEVIPVYIGDDITDEDAYREIRDSGIGIQVGRHGERTGAKYFLKNVSEVRAFLKWMSGINDLNNKQSKMTTNIRTWNLLYDEYLPDQEGRQEALCTLGNGYFATRGAAEETSANKIHYPGTYIAGGYNRLSSEIKGKVIENEDFVNWPNWLVLSFKHAEGEWLDLDKMRIIEYQKRLNMEEGLLERDFIVEDGHKRRTRIQSKRLVHLSKMHLAAIQWKMQPLNWEGKVLLRSALDGRVINNGVARYRDLNSQHLVPLDTGKFGDHGIFLKVKTTQSEITMAQASITDLFSNGHEIAVHRQLTQDEGYIEEILSLDVQEQREYHLEKIVALFTSRDRAITEPVIEAQKEVERAPRFEKLKDMQKETLDAYWARFDIDIESEDPQDQRLLRLHIFHLLQTVSANNIDLDAGVPARGLHGEAYRGHIFWDELFIFPFINLSVPEITRSLLMYRYRRLDEARIMAKEAGYEGAMFPWQSGSNGREESQVIHLNPQSGNWIPDHTHLQRHVNGAIAYNVWQYYQITQDYEFLYYYGAEMLLEIAKFWASKATYNEDRERYEILNVVGPDEYHTKYPGSDNPGLNNNAYTNVLASWTLYIAQKALDVLDERYRKELLLYTDLSEDDIQYWREIDHHMFIPITEEGIIMPFEGWDTLEELDWEHYHEEYGEILRLDRILEKEGDSTNRYQASKQADVLMLFYLFSSDALQKQFKQMGYDFSPDWIPKNIEYYTQRTAHGSTLSKMVHSWVLARKNRERSWHNFAKALVSDFSDIQGGTTEEGIHLGAMAGTIDLMQRCYTGLEYREDMLWFNPQLPDNLKSIRFRLRYRSRWIKVEVDNKRLQLICDSGQHVPLLLNVRGKECELHMGEALIFDLENEQCERVDADTFWGSKS